MNVADIVVVHADAGSASDLRRRLQDRGYSVAEPLTNGTDIDAVGASAAVIHGASVSVPSRLMTPSILLATEDYELSGNPGFQPDAIVTEPLRGRELENAVELVLRRSVRGYDRA